MKLLGSVLYALGDLPAARTALEFSLHLQPAYADAHCDLGTLPLFQVLEVTRAVHMVQSLYCDMVQQ
jgi:hypothetical protein